MDLHRLAARSPTAEYDYFDLERLLAHTLDQDRLGMTNTILAPFATQVRGYIATIEAYVALGLVKDPGRFVRQKLLAARHPRPTPPSAEMLDTLAECSWGLFLHDQHGSLEEEKPLPGGVGDADFFIQDAKGPLWIDCISIAPSAEQFDLSSYLTKVVSDKWHRKFGARSGAASVRASVAVTLLKNQENVVGRLRFDQAIGASLLPKPNLWADCPGLESAWFAVPPFGETAHRPEIFATWQRP
jgi:hypothetical protein